MKLLLDTHAAIWATTAPERLSDRVRSALEEADVETYVSVAAVWEIAIKHPLGRSDAPPLSACQALAEFEAAGFHMLSITAAHATRVERLPPIHADPFDRLMLAQAIVEDLLFVTYDRHLSRYGVPVVS